MVELFLAFSLLNGNRYRIVSIFRRHENLKQRLKFEELGTRKGAHHQSVENFQYFTNMSMTFRTPLTLIEWSFGAMSQKTQIPRKQQIFSVVQEKHQKTFNCNQLITFNKRSKGD